MVTNTPTTAAVVTATIMGAPNGVTCADLADLCDAAGCSSNLATVRKAARKTGAVVTHIAATNDTPAYMRYKHPNAKVVTCAPSTPAPCAPCAPCNPAPVVDETPAPCAPCTPAPCTPGIAALAALVRKPAAPKQRTRKRSRVNVTLEMLQRPQGTTVSELAAAFASEFGTGLTSTATQAIHKVPKAQLGTKATNVGTREAEGRVGAVYTLHTTAPCAPCAPCTPAPCAPCTPATPS